MERYTFAPLREDDLERARGWLREPHVARWFRDDPEEHDYPEGTIRDWTEAIRGEDPTDMFLIQLDGRAIGVLQSYRVDEHPDYVEQLGPLPAPAFGIDLLIGERELIGKGHGPMLIRVFLQIAAKRYGLEYCVIGPSKSNTAAIRAYEKAGFHYLKDYREEDALEPPHVLLDLWTRDISLHDA